MAMRMAEIPTGGSRIAYAVLATVLAGLGGALLATVAWPLLISDRTCADDPTELCLPALGLVFYSVGCWLVLAWLAYAFRLGWLFVAIIVVGQLVAGQAAVEWISGWPIAGLLVLVPLAAWLSSPGQLVAQRGGASGPVLDPPTTVPGRRLLVVASVLVVLVVQLAWWLWRVVA